MEHAIPMRLSRDIADISKGKNQSKWRVVWRFCFEGIPREHVITLTHSVLSGKKRIEHNGRPVFSSTGRVVGEFSHRMLLKDHRLGAVITSTNAYELFVDGRRFEELPEASFSMMDAWRREALPGSAATMASNGSTRSEVRGVDFADFTGGGGSGPGSRRASGAAAAEAPSGVRGGGGGGATAFDVVGAGAGFDDDAGFDPRARGAAARPARPVIRAPSARGPAAATAAGTVWEAVTGRAGTATQIRSMDDEDEGQAFGFTDSYGEVGAGTPTGRAPAPGRAAAPRAAIAAATADDDAFGWGSGSGLEQSAGGPPAPGRTPSRAPGAAAARGRGTAVGGSGGRQRQPDPFDDDAGDAFSDGLDDGRAHRGVGGDADAFGEGVGEFADASGAGAAVDPFAEDVDDAPPNVAEEVSMLNFETDAPRAGGVGGGGGISAGGGGGGGSGGDGFDDDDLFGPAPAPAAGGGGGVAGLIASEVDDVFAAAPAGLGGGSASGGGDGGGGGGGADASSRRSEVDEATLVNLEDLTGVVKELKKVQEQLEATKKRHAAAEERHAADIGEIKERHAAAEQCLADTRDRLGAVESNVTRLNAFVAALDPLFEEQQLAVHACDAIYHVLALRMGGFSEHEPSSSPMVAWATSRRGLIVTSAAATSMGATALVIKPEQRGSEDLASMCRKSVGRKKTVLPPRWISDLAKGRNTHAHEFGGYLGAMPTLSPCAVKGAIDRIEDKAKEAIARLEVEPAASTAATTAAAASAAAAASTGAVATPGDEGVSAVEKHVRHMKQLLDVITSAKACLPDSDARS
ncbi:hypothetical protein FNF29_07966 [Cafeteria roenbergensis]|uniref:Uncharacterized protein n=1 Tax=Cafeteria roenbergensis TaxID=33653 RepID=A0A5A8C1Z0_CAFRO|nr:hypothetical protein FNF29_07966 [Cafeteria roenbergensis]|eukprot:KAA0146559.1 hypothetical protein FNF29_07966 [Cafeteria roenbergensis]